MTLSPHLEAEVYNAKVDLILGKSIPLKAAIALLEKIERDVGDEDALSKECDFSYDEGFKEGQAEAEREANRTIRDLEEKIERLQDRFNDYELR